MMKHILVIDDDAVITRTISSILSRNKAYEIFTVENGIAALEFLRMLTPDLILLDIDMPEMDGFETLRKIREIPAAKEVPVVFLTGRADLDAEETGFLMGASDFIRKPVRPNILLLRVDHLLELYTLRNDLRQEVELRTVEIESQKEQIEQLVFQISDALAGAIDAKDTYTSGHSLRVATYAKEIAMRYCYSAEMQENVFMTGLLHDVGKIGIPNAIINKPSKLTDDEYDIIKTHPGIGAKILERITAVPFIAIGAHWHHERYDGKGYPDGLKGEEIPEIARIIGVADAYDAMSSKRSYRDPLPQDVIRDELIKGSGTQFDPRFAAIMLEMIDSDKDYQMKEH